MKGPQLNEGATVVTDELTRYFGETIALDSLTLNVAAGEVFGLLGHNGAGKTTTVRLLNGLLKPTRGSAKVFGLSPTEGLAGGVAARRAYCLAGPAIWGINAALLKLALDRFQRERLLLGGL